MGKCHMSEDWLLEDMRQARRRDYFYAIIIVLLLANIGGTVFLFAYTHHYITEQRLRNDVLETQLYSLSQDIYRLRTQLSLQKYLNASEFMVLPQIYNETMFSVVMIKVKTPSGYGQGSGFVYDKSGYIITNNHVVEDAIEIEVTFVDGTIVPATLVGRDPYSDLAVIRVKVDPDLLHPLPLGNSSDLMVGETVIAIGNPYGLSNSMSVGIVSQVGRELSAPGGYIIVDVIQTDAAINPGNSGGPMLNLRGEVVGMNTAILTRTGEWSGIGFAIPSDTIKRELPSLIENGSYEHPYLGVTGTDLTPDLAEAMGLPNTTRGALIIEVKKGGPSDGKLWGGNRWATIAGETIKVGGDVIIAIDGQTIKSFYDLVLYLERNKRPGDEVIFTVIRRGQVKPILVTVKLGVRPPP